MTRVEAIEKALEEGIIEVPSSLKGYCSQLLVNNGGNISEAFAEILKVMNGQLLAAGHPMDGGYVLSTLTKLFYGLVEARINNGKPKSCH